jgi:hypothetical protein
MRFGFDGLAAQVASVLNADPFSGHLFLFRSKRADYLKVLYWDGTGLCLFANRLERGQFVSYGLCQGILTRVTQRPAIDAHSRIDAIRKGEDAGFSRRSLRLLCGDWLPHDDGASEVCPTLATDISVGAVQNKLGDSLYRVGVLAAADREMCRAQAPRGTRCPIDQMNPSSSRATATVATTERLPRAVNRR